MADKAVLQHGSGGVYKAREAAKSAVDENGNCKAQVFAGSNWITVGLEEEGVLGRLTLEALEDKAHIFQAVINAFRGLGDLEEIQEEVLAVVLY